MNQLFKAENNLTFNGTVPPPMAALENYAPTADRASTALTTPAVILNPPEWRVPTSRPLYYGRLAKGFGAATGILGIAGQACFGTGLGYYSTAALGTTLYLLTPLPWLGQKIPDSFIDAGRTGDRWMIAGAVLTGAATVATILTITFGAKSRQPKAR